MAQLQVNMRFSFSTFLQGVSHRKCWPWWEEILQASLARYTRLLSTDDDLHLCLERLDSDRTVAFILFHLAFTLAMYNAFRLERRTDAILRSEGAPRTRRGSALNDYISWSCAGDQGKTYYAIVEARAIDAVVSQAPVMTPDGNLMETLWS